MFVSLHKGSVKYFITNQRANIYDSRPKPNRRCLFTVTYKLSIGK